MKKLLLLITLIFSSNSAYAIPDWTTEQFKEFDKMIVERLPTELKSISLLSSAFDIDCKSCSLSQTAKQNFTLIFMRIFDEAGKAQMGATPGIHSVSELAQIAIKQLGIVVQANTDAEAKELFCASSKCNLFSEVLLNAACVESEK
jgi:hypothetical protein